MDDTMKIGEVSHDEFLEKRAGMIAEGVRILQDPEVQEAIVAVRGTDGDIRFACISSTEGAAAIIAHMTHRLAHEAPGFSFRLAANQVELAARANKARAQKPAEPVEPVAQERPAAPFDPLKH